jgi:hypothetical protein
MAAAGDIIVASCPLWFSAAPTLPAMPYPADPAPELPSARISVIVPAHRAARTLGACLSALRSGTLAPLETMVVDDASDDATREIARGAGAVVIHLPGRSGPAAARNAGAAAARGEILLFVDADVVVPADAIDAVHRAFAADRDLAALFGSYDAEPDDPGLVSQFKNLAHHFVHQQAREESGSFWAGCGAIRREVFVAAGGFDAERYRRASIEDIELGVRLWRAGYRVRLVKALQVRHMKRWTVASAVRSDIFDRAIPWGSLLAQGRTPPPDLNLTAGHRLASVASWLLVASGLATAGVRTRPAAAAAAGVGAAAVALVLLVNARFYRFLRRARGGAFLIGAIPLHVLHYLCGSAALGLSAAARWLTSKAGYGQA